ncbi:hypothetical protein C1H46_001864 [Malus baccata]|uniref:Uncharacterized protein n=1 Tax=Malus baccata TaxID=106549 RepID=A0A540NPE4_MALBA|nr:hypothetical protein C1H46_001864 [Malus baccata]
MAKRRTNSQQGLSQRIPNRLGLKENQDAFIFFFLFHFMAFAFLFSSSSWYPHEFACRRSWISSLYLSPSIIWVMGYLMKLRFHHKTNWQYKE